MFPFTKNLPLTRLQTHINFAKELFCQEKSKHSRRIKKIIKILCTFVIFRKTLLDINALLYHFIAVISSKRVKNLGNKGPKK